jgi:cbb3-type cytochrome oxidase subunit 3
MDPSLYLPGALLLLGCVVYIFWPQQRLALTPTHEKTRLDYLRERKDVIYDNLRDLNFEYRAGKFPEADYARQREALEQEAAQVLSEMDLLGAA